MKILQYSIIIFAISTIFSSCRNAYDGVIAEKYMKNTHVKIFYTSSGKVSFPLIIKIPEKYYVMIKNEKNTFHSMEINKQQYDTIIIGGKYDGKYR